MKCKHIFVTDEHIRSLSGLILKNNIKARYKELPAEVIEYIKAETLACFGDSSSLIRATMGILITSVLIQESQVNWPDLFNLLSNKLEAGNEIEVENSYSILQKICEDSSVMNEPEVFQEQLSVFIPKFLEAFTHSNSKVRCNALSCINSFIINRTQALMPFIDIFIDNLSKIATDPDGQVRQNVCKAFVLLVEVRMDRLIPHIHTIIEVSFIFSCYCLFLPNYFPLWWQYMLMSTQDQDPDVAVDACEFWLTLAEQPIFKEVLAPHLPRLIPVLMQKMKYSVLEVMLKEEEDEMVPDRDQDIRPHIYHGRQHTQSRMDSNNGDEGGIESDDEDDDFDNSDWNLRKCSAAALDLLANNFHDDLLPTVLEILKETLFHEDWITKEAAILALGAIAEGCMLGIAQHLSEIVPYLIHQGLNDKKALVRSITCWTLSRYSHWIVHQQNPDMYLKPLISEVSILFCFEIH